MSITVAELNEVVIELFKALDKDKSGYLEKMEILEIAHQLHAKMEGPNAFNEAAFEEAFTKLDINGDGKISQHELYEWFLVAAKKRGLIAQ